MALLSALPFRIAGFATYFRNSFSRLCEGARILKWNHISGNAITFCVALLVAPAGSAQAQSPGQMPAAQPFTVVLDAAHGAQETGTTLSPQLLEKDLTLRLSVRLRSALAARGIRVVTTREGDTNPPPETRAAEANHARAGACLLLHATASGSGVHLYTSSLGQAAAPATGPQLGLGASLVPWSSAGAPFATASLQLASELSTALSSAGLPFTLGRVRLAPMDAMRCPAVAVEMAPLRPVGAAGHGSQAAIDDEAYQNRVLDALAAALLAWRAGAGAR